MKKMNKKGFTIVELVIVIAVIAILAAVLIPTFSGVVGKANDSARTQEMTNALKVVLAGNAETGALAENTIFVTSSKGTAEYYAIYNGNKLGDITAIPTPTETKPYPSFAKYTTEGETPVSTLRYNTSATEFVTFNSVILPFDATTKVFNLDSCKALAVMFGASLPTESFVADENGQITVNDVKINVYSNVDLASGMVVLSPTK